MHVRVATAIGQPNCHLRNCKRSIETGASWARNSNAAKGRGRLCRNATVPASNDDFCMHGLLFSYRMADARGAVSEDSSEVARASHGDLPRKQLGEAVIEVFGIGKSYKLAGEGSVPALRSIDLNGDSDLQPIRRGEFVMIRGPSGGGKTSLLNIVGTIDTPTAGHLKLFGQTIDPKTSTDAFLSDLRLRRIGFVFQSFNLLATLSAYENVELPMSLRGKRSSKERKAATTALLRDVGLEDRMMHLPSELSGGEQQRVAIARALANEPDVLLLDEPTGDLDTRNTVAVMDLLLGINLQRGMTCVMVTHNPDLECYADRILYVADGAFVGQAINTEQTRLDIDSYVRYLHRDDDDDDGVTYDAGGGGAH